MRKLTQAFIVLTILVIIFYDLYIVAVGGYEATVSRVILDFSSKWPIAAFVFGIVCGHLFWPQIKEEHASN